MDPRWKHPFTCIVAGPTGCGKTTFVTRLLRNSSTMIDSSPERVMWYYGEWQSVYENLDIPVSKKQEESHHQFEFTIHSGVQESARCVANDYIGQTDVPRSIQVCSGGVRRCDVNSLRVYFGRFETGHPRGSTLAHVHTTGRRCSVGIHAKSINSRAPCVTPYSTILCADSRST